MSHLASVDVKQNVLKHHWRACCGVVGDGVCTTSDDHSHSGNITVGDGNDVAVDGDGNSGCSIVTAE